ncbi:MAG: tetratricopeptide repeat protein [Cyanobacteria bacterium P01_A01_bin.105]
MPICPSVFARNPIAMLNRTLPVLSLPLLAVFSATLLGAAAVPGMAQTPSLEEQLRQPVNSSALTQSRDVADQLLRLGRQMAASGQYESAILAWEQAIELYYDIGDRIGMGTVYENMAQTYSLLGLYDEAETAVRRQLAIARDNANFQSQIYAWNTLGTLRLQRGLLDSALSAYEEGFAVAQSVEDFEGMGLSLSNLGLVSRILGKDEDALNYFQTAGNLRARSGDRLGQANTNNNLGDIYRASGEEGQALGAYRLALRLSRDLDSQDLDNSTPTQLRALDGLINVYADQANWPQMRYYLDERIALTRMLDSDWQQLLTLRYLGLYYAATGALPEAQSAYRQSLALARQLEQSTLEGELIERLRDVTRTLNAEGD